MKRDDGFRTGGCCSMVLVIPSDARWTVDSDLLLCSSLAAGSEAADHPITVR